MATWISALHLMPIHLVKSRYRSPTAFAQFHFTMRNVPVLHVPIAPFALLRVSRVPHRVDHSSGYQLSQLPLRDEPIAHFLFLSTFISAAPLAELKILHRDIYC
jgi:hypothetical protein